jgi:hypothetical protein
MAARVMDRPKHRWFIVLAVTLGCGVLLVGRQWMSTTSAPVPARTGTTATQVVESGPGASTTVEPAPTHVRPASPATTSGTFRGRVIDAVTRQPVPEFEVRLFPLQNSSFPFIGEPLTRTFQSSTGRFAWNDLEARTWSAMVSAHGYRQFRLPKFPVVAGKESREVVMPLLRGFTVRGRVFDVHSGTGIAEAYVGFYDPYVRARQGDDPAEPYTQTRSDGTFELDGIPDGEIVVMASSKNHAAGEATVVVSEKTPPVEIGLSTGGSISGRVMTSAGAPIKAMVMLNGPGSGPYETTDEGVFSFDHLRAGSYTLTSTTTAGSAKEKIELAPDEHRPDVILTVVEGRTVRGTLRGLRPDQLEGAFVSARSEAKRQFFNSRPDEQGAYALKGLPPGRATLTAWAHGRQMEKKIDVPADRDLVLDMVFPLGGRLSGRVTQGGKPAADKFVMMGSADAKSGIVYRAQTSQDGRYEIEGLPAGEYRFKVEDDVGRSIAIAGDTVLNIEIPAVQVGGRVLEDAGAVPIVGAEIYVRGMDAATSRVHAYERSDDFGEFKMTGVEPGDLELTVYKPGYEMYRERIAYSSPITGKTIRLRRGGGVEVRVQRSANGEPAHGFLVSEKLADGPWVIDYWIPLDQNGIGFIPTALIGGTLVIRGDISKPIIIREWDGSSLDLTF